MSHRDDCPDEWDASAAGRRDAQDWGYSRSYRFEECEEAQSAYRRGFYAEQERQQEEQWLFQMQEQAAYEAAQEEAYWNAMAEDQAAQSADTQAVTSAASAPKSPNPTPADGEEA